MKPTLVIDVRKTSIADEGVLADESRVRAKTRPPAQGEAAERNGKKAGESHALNYSGKLVKT